MDYTNCRIKVRKEWYEYPKEGKAVGNPVFIDQLWLPILWDDEEDPTFFKFAGIELA